MHLLLGAAHIRVVMHVLNSIYVFITKVGHVLAIVVPFGDLASRRHACFEVCHAGACARSAR
jgi:hypothetical protein